ncbi:MAG TPA: bifunctional DNA-formamidopyrimidine glycosylase/DNA-(apurinic or apyrimidinic site) lyase [Gemmatimonadaceae bacterium]|nr:bifunctional DNA-formamidopyrimidine glycosylase/DNA-(apurinic or apyrimidinic site) lyase [Gemmatimonadaceae bacterium]
MPELPEVEVAARVLRAAAQGRTIRSLRLLHPSLARRVSSADCASLVGRRVTAVERRGKHQLLHLDDGRALHAHFRMTGDWTLVAAGGALPRYARAVLEFDDGSALALDDSRALATLAVHAAADDALPALGPEADDPALDATTLRAALRARRAPIKTVLLDQRVVAGLGNIYAAEALWRARIDPRTAASSLSAARVSRLLDAVRAVLERAMAAPGRYQDGASAPLDVYGREGEPCRRCGAKVRRVVQGGRSTYFCARCQR